MQYQANLADDQLIQLYLNGDTNALSTLVHLNKDKIYSSIYLMVQSQKETEEIFGQVFAHIIDHLMAGKPVEEGKFLQWATRIAHNMCLDYFSKQGRGINDNSVEQQKVVNIAVNVITQKSNHEAHDSIRKIIESLPGEQKQVLVLRHYADLSFKEIADIMKCSISDVLGCMRYGLNNLGKAMVEKQVA